MFFDIGANRGAWAIANLPFCSKIVAVEASRAMYGTLVENTRGHPITTVCKAVCGENKEVTFYQADCDVLSTLNPEWLTSPESRFAGYKFVATTAEGVTLDQLIATYGVPQLIKIDVEGAEDQVIKSLSTKVNLLCFEWARELDNVAEKCIEHLSLIGFTQYCVQHADNYTFRPQDSDFRDAQTAMETVRKTELKLGWGMIWCR